MSSSKASAKTMSAAPSATSDLPMLTSDAPSTPTPRAVQAQPYLEKPKGQQRRSETLTAAVHSLHDSMRPEDQNPDSAEARSPSSSPENAKDPQQTPEASDTIQRSGKQHVQRLNFTAEASSTPVSTLKRAVQTSIGERGANKSSAPSSPQAGPDVDRIKTPKEDTGADGGSAPSSYDFAEASSVTEGGLHLAKTHEPASGGEDITPLTRTKSDIAPWMTQRHKRAIRRSLEAAAASSSPIKSPASKSAPAPTPEKSARDGDSGELK
ncbi:uncharacterized protein UTRI_03744 [Ustilago trichophora]|uniref:Uncharacterized protein n=1 Tax=Ustilago trichophora TaxID=86804 RepID=A0A5C3E4I3_9BASI|nr:uncharacterized protein UTRI_03744 [Ustilago trichophora]